MAKSQMSIERHVAKTKKDAVGGVQLRARCEDFYSAAVCPTLLPELTALKEEGRKVLRIVEPFAVDEAINAPVETKFERLSICEKSRSVVVACRSDARATSLGARAITDSISS